ncbi:diacylglycerol/lipid kinase family protein [Microscilla marina]|uniref:Diacylglycerol kinase related protein, putative n=1 Tax=Microscilla marina ATCC 23134 TaxID=313606 RepID=A1ZYH9_MICM2|nr:diacylglycerol kinase family protein [Microscilla marina]EAY24563.1 diacylglycerol kinase related protein, putative [Microscilla marina ATCC 23134]
MKLLFLVNPISGGVDKTPFMEVANQLCNKYGIDFQVFETTGNNDKECFEKQLNDYQPDRVAVVGGDGTVQFASIALQSTHYAMGIVPLGSANGMAEELGVNNDPTEAFKDLLLSHLIVPLDLLQVNKAHQLLHIGDVGTNAELVNKYENDSRRGMMTYAKYLLSELVNLTPFEVKIEANGEVIEKSAIMVAICNAQKYGTGIPLNLSGNPLDGQFELVVIEKVGVKSLINAGLSKFDPRFFDDEHSTIITTKEARICLEKSRLLQLDGEVIGEVETIDVGILPGVVQLITNKDNPHV